jgi:hypothetical protein
VVGFVRLYPLAVLPVVAACAFGAALTATAVDQPEVSYLEEHEQLDIASLSDELI